MSELKILKKLNMECSICGEVHEVEYCEGISNNIVKNEEVKYIEHFYRCNKFGIENTFMSGDMWNESLINSLDSYRKNHDLLTSKEIKGIRSKYGLTQAELAFLMGIGEVTITRYETKQIQEVTFDNMLKEINNNAILALNLLEKNSSKFTIERYEVISNNIKSVIDKETLVYLKEQVLIGRYVMFDVPSINNGNCVMKLDKLINVLAYLVKQYGEIKKVVLMKLLWYIDNVSYKENKKAITGLVYTHMTYGALPIGYNELLEMPSLNYTEEWVSEDIKECKINYNKNYKIVGLSKKEKDIIDKVVNKFRNYSSMEIASYMHKEEAYKNTYPREIISFEFAESLKEF